MRVVSKSLAFSANILRVIVRAGWLGNNHINVPADISGFLFTSVPAAEPSVRVHIRTHGIPRGEGALQRTNGHLTGVADAFDAMNVTAIDTDRRRLRIWGTRTNATLSIHIEDAPTTTTIAWLTDDESVALPKAIDPQEEIIWIERASMTIVGHLPLRRYLNPRRTSNVHFLDEPAEVGNNPMLLANFRREATTVNEPTADLLVRRILEATAPDRNREQPTLNVALSSQLAAAEEGTPQIAMHLVRERSTRLVRSKRRSVLERDGVLRCEVCAFVFSTLYGDRGAAFCEVHHKAPLGAIGAARITTLDDLAVVCANCHRMLHKEPFMSVDELRATVDLARANGKPG